MKKIFIAAFTRNSNTIVIRELGIFSLEEIKKDLYKKGSKWQQKARLFNFFQSQNIELEEPKFFVLEDMSLSKATKYSLPVINGRGSLAVYLADYTILNSAKILDTIEKRTGFKAKKKEINSVFDYIFTKKVKNRFLKGSMDPKDFSFVEDLLHYDENGKPYKTLAFKYKDIDRIFYCDWQSFKEFKLPEYFIFSISTKEDNIKRFLFTKKVISNFSKGNLSLENIDIEDVVFESKESSRVAVISVKFLCKISNKVFTYSGDKFRNGQATKEHKNLLINNGGLDYLKIPEVLTKAKLNGRDISNIEVKSFEIKNNKFSHIIYSENGVSYRQIISKFTKGELPKTKVGEKKFTYFIVGKNIINGLRTIKVGSSDNYKRRTSGEIDKAYSFKADHLLCVIKGGFNERKLAYYITKKAVEDKKQHLTAVERKNKEKYISIEFYDYNNVYNYILSYLKENDITFIENNIPS